MNTRFLHLFLIFSLLIPSFSFAQMDSPNLKTLEQQRELLSEKFSELYEQDRFEDEKGNEITIRQVFLGNIKTFTHIPLNSKIKYLYKTNQEKQSVTVAALKEDGTRISARLFKIDESLSAEENLLKIEQMANAFEAELETLLAKNFSHKKSFNRFPASILLVSMIGVMVSLLGVGMGTYFCAKNPSQNAIHCALAAFMAMCLLINLFTAQTNSRS